MGLFKKLLDIFPIDEVIDEGFEIFRTRVAVIDVVGVDAEDGGAGVNKRIFPVWRLCDFEPPILEGEPSPP